MNKIIYSFLILLCLLGIQFTAKAQCAWDNSQFGTYSTSGWTVGATNTLSPCFFGGEYAFVTNLVNGATYTFATCGDTDFDSQITIYESGPGAVLGYNDDGCGAQSTVTITYVAGSGSIDVLIDQYNCVSNSLCMTLTGTLVSLPPVAPANDNCSGAVAITPGNGSCTSPATTDNTGATDSGIGDPGCANYAGGDVWHSVVVPCTGNLTVATGSVAGSPVGDTGLALYSGACGTLTFINCNDDGNGLFSLIALTGRTPGETIYIRTWEYGNNSFGQYTVCAWDPTLPPANDECAAAVALSVGSGSCTTPTNGTNVGATDSGITWPVACNGDELSYAGGDVWYSLVVPSGCDDLVIETSDDGTGSFDTQIAVWDACGGTLIDCSDDAVGLFSKVVIPSINLVPGSTIYVGVSAYGNAYCGTFNICAYTQTPAAPANDVCLGAIALPAPDFGSCITQTVVSNLGATADGAASCVAIENNVWYSVTIPTTACAGQTLNVEMSDDGTTTLDDPQLVIFDACGGTEVACDDDSGVDFYSLATVLIDGINITPGQTLYITIDGFGGDCGTANICSYITNSACPVIDHTPDVTAVCHMGNVTFTPGAACTLDGIDQVADLYVYIDPATGEPGTAPAPLTIVPGTQASQMAALHPDWQLLNSDGDCATPLVAQLINTSCAPVNASLAIVTYNYALDSDCDGDASEYDGCMMLPFSITVYPDPNNFMVTTTPGTCGTAPTAVLELLDGTDCATQTGTASTCTTALPLNYSFTVNAGQTCQRILSGTVSNTLCTNCFNFGIFDPCVCNNDATTLTNGTFGETVAVWNDANGNGLLDAGEGLPAGQIWTVSAQTGATGAPVGTALTYGVIPPASANPAGISGYYVQFSHVDAVGYTMSVEGPAALGTLGNATLNQAATCTYPNPTFSVAGSPFCSDAAAIPLSGSEPNGANTAATPYSGTGVTGNQFDPAAAGVGGPYTLTYNYDPTGNSNNQCLQPVTTTVTVINCTAPCNAVNGTPTFNP